MTLKRTLDYVVGVPLFVAALPVMGLIALAVRLVSPGPVLFWQERGGYQGQVIRMVKFRTMNVDADERLRAHFKEHPERETEWLSIFKLEDDPRIIPFVGKFLRRSSLDELPNLWNLLRGDVSLVGPRPFPMYHLDQLDPEFRSLRATVRPGLTGPWQIERGGVEAQLALDTFYVEHWSILLDLRLLARTVPMLVQARKGHY